MNIFQNIAKSVYGPDFYSGLKSASTKSAFKYYFKLIALLAVLSAVVWSIFVLPQIKDALTPEVIRQVTAYYPADLNLKIQDGVLSTDAKLPYIIPVPKDSKQEDYGFGRNDQYENFVVIDTRVETFSTDLLEKNKVPIFIGKSFVASKQNNGLVKVMSLSEYKNFIYEFNRANLEKTALGFLPLLNKLANVLPFLMLFVFFVSQVFAIIGLLIMALIVWLVLVIKKDSAGYKYALRLTIYAATLALIINSVVGAVRGIPGNGWGVVILTIIVVLINTKKGVAASAA